MDDNISDHHGNLYQDPIISHEIHDHVDTAMRDIDKDALADFIKEKIKQRECKSYVPKRNGDCQCGRDKNLHDGEGKSDSNTKITWNMKDHSKEFPCDSFGEIKFEGFGNEILNSPYVRVGPETDLESLWTIMRKYWKLPPPTLLISVTGGAKRFKLSPNHQKIFKRGLMNAATTTGAWIITGGMGAGVMKFVGEAVRDHILTKGTSKKNIVALGIATWGCVANRDCLCGDKKGLWPAAYKSTDLSNIKKTDGKDLDETKNREVPLDHNHTHFILVDNGSINKYGVEIEFGARLEKFISKKIDKGIKEGERVDLPVVKIVVEGGVNTMDTVSKSVNEDIPVLALEGSGRVADLIAFGYHFSKDKKNKEKFDEKLKVKADELDWKETDKKDKAVEKVVQQLKDILSDSRKRKMMNICNLNEADKKGIDRAILYALLKAKRSNTGEQLALALAWNRCDIARNEIFKHSNRKHWKTSEEHFHAMFTALDQDRVDFVQLFLDYGFVSLSEFLTRKVLEMVYATSMKNVSNSSVRLIDQLNTNLQQCLATCCRQPKHLASEKISLKSVGKIIAHLLQDESMNLYKVDDNKINGSSNKLENPEKDLFIWAILFNRQEMAKMFWKMSKDQIAGALLACALLKKLAIKADNIGELELSVSLKEHSVIYEDLATAVLGECYRQNKQEAHQLIVRKLKMYGGTTLFTLAEANDLMKFMGHTCCQTKLNLIWRGRMVQYTQIWKILISIIAPIMIPLIKFTNKQSPVDNQNNYDALKKGDEVKKEPNEEVGKNQVKAKGDIIQQPNEKFSRNKVKPKDGIVQNQDQGTKYLQDPIHTTTNMARRGFTMSRFPVAKLFNDICCFYTAPITVFIVYNISYLIFLAIFTYFVLTELDPDSPSILECVTWGWAVTMLIEDFRQIVARDHGSIKFKFCRWFSSIWSIFDLVIYILFLVSVITRYVLSNDQFVWARITYSITLGIYYLRFLQAFFVEKHIGPKVIMIKNMIVDLMFFVLIFVIFLLSFGVAYQANLFPNSEPNWYLLQSVLYRPYWQVFGKILQGDMEDDCTTNETKWRAAGGQGRCPADNALVPLLAAIYVILTNILLINLLIAMFSHTFRQVQKQSENVWRFYRFSVVYEYYDRPFLCPPFIIFIHFYRFCRFLRYVLGKCECKYYLPENEFKLELSDKENNHLTLFEKSALEEYQSCFQKLELETVDRKISDTQESHKATSCTTDNTGEEMQMCLDELGNQVAQNSHHINQMMQMLQQILRNQNKT